MLSPEVSQSKLTLASLRASPWIPDELEGVGTEVVLVEPVVERGSVDEDDRVLYKGVGSDELVIGSVVDRVDDGSLPGDCLGRPVEVTVVVGQGSELGVASSGSDGSDLFGTELGVGCGSAAFEFSLLLVDRHATSSKPMLMS